MIIKKIAKQCREHRTIISMFKHDTLWVGHYAAVYALSGLPDMTGEQIAVSFDFSEKQKKDTNYTEGETLNLPVEDEHEGEWSLKPPEDAVINGSDMKVFRHGGKILFCDAEAFEPLKDLKENVGLSFSIRMWSKTPLVAVRSGFFLVALIAPMSFQTETLKDWCDKQRQLIVDVEDYVAQLALEKAEDEALDESQVTMEEA